MTPLLVLLAARMTGDQALARTKSALLAFDVSGPFRVQTLGRYGTAANPDNWMSTVAAPGGARYSAYFDRNDRLRSLVREGTPPQGRGLLSPANAARMARWLAKVGPRYPVQPWTEQDSATGRFYQAVVAGRPFVEPRYFYAFTLNEHGAFASFHTYDDPPPTGPAIPRVPQAAAEKAASTVFQTYFRPGRVEYRLDPKATRLAWLETGASPPAVLVWRVTGLPTILGGSWSKSPQAVELYYDAITGQRVERRRSR